MSTSDDWVASTAALPVAFAQVREDPLVDQRLLEELGRQARVLMIASGGETASLLATLPIERLQLVDMNPAQLSLTRLKLAMLGDASSDQRLALLGHAEMSSQERDAELQRRFSELGIPPDGLGPRSLVAQYGPDFCGRYEWVFARLRELLADCGEEIRRILLLSDPPQQSACVDPTTHLGRRLDQAFSDAMALQKLVAIFGAEATANRVMPFAEHFLLQTRRALRTFAASENPYLHQIFLGRFPGPTWPWLELPPQSRLCAFDFSQGAMQSVLASMPDQGYDMIHLSNILDWISPADASMLLGHAHRCLSPGGLVVIRQLNSSLDIPAVPCGFRWNRDLAEQLHRGDRSFFYRALHVGMRS